MHATIVDWPYWWPHVIWGKHQCPRCTSVQFRAAELRSCDWLLGLLALQPVRCLYCWRRYYWFAFHPEDSN